MNRSLLTGLPFLPLCTGVSVHISFCSQESASPQLARRGKPKSLPVAPIVVYLRHSPESCHNVSQRPEQIPKPPTRDSHITMAIKSLDPRKPAAQKISAFRPRTLPSVQFQSSNSQLAIRPDANQHLRMAPHSRLQQRQRAVAHLPVFLSAAVSTRPSPSLPAGVGKNNIPAAQSHTLCHPPTIRQSAFPSIIPPVPQRRRQSKTLTCTHSAASAAAPCPLVSSSSSKNRPTRPESIQKTHWILTSAILS